MKEFRHFVENSLRALVAKGDVVAEELIANQNLADKIMAAGFRLRPHLDYRTAIYMNALKFAENEHWVFSIIFFAMYFEHSLNSILIGAMRRKKLSAKTQERVLKANLDDKLTWVLELLGLSPIAEVHRKTIKAVSDKRNGLVHYKFTHENFDYEPELTELIKAVPSLVRYLKGYESRVRFSGNKKKIRQVVSELVPLR